MRGHDLQDGPERRADDVARVHRRPRRRISACRPLRGRRRELLLGARRRRGGATGGRASDEAAAHFEIRLSCERAHAGAQLVHRSAVDQVNREAERHAECDGEDREQSAAFAQCKTRIEDGEEAQHAQILAQPGRSSGSDKRPFRHGICNGFGMPARALLVCVFATLACLTGCEPFSIAAMGVGGGAAVTPTLGGINYKTFTASSASVRSASLVALQRMGIKYTGSEKGPNGSEVLSATATDRSIEITLEPLSPSSTRMKVVARNGRIFTDSATATEIILQTERQLGGKA